MSKDATIMFLFLLLLIESVAMALSSVFHHKERKELTRMLAARDYNEFAAHEIDGKGKNKGHPHKNMVTKQQDKMTPKRE